MKRKVLYFGGLLMVTTMMLVGCFKTKTVTVNNYFEVQGGTLVEKSMPEATSSNSVDVSMNSSVIAGGSSIVTVNSPATIKKVMVGVEDEYGYYEIAPNTTGTSFTFTLIVNQNINLGEEDTFPILVGVVDNSGNIYEIWRADIRLIEAGTGALQVSLSFNNAKDVDLHLFEPNGEHIYYGHRTSSNGGHLDLDSNAGCGIDNINNENITYDEEAYVEPGTYTVYVDLWSNCDPTIATDYVVSVFYGGSLISAQTGTNPYSGRFPVDAPSNYNNLSNIEPVMTFVIPDNGQKKVRSYEPEPLSESAREKMAMEE